MGVADSLKSVTKAFPEAKVVAFADLSSRMILASVGGEDTTQERLDRLCQQARASFDDPLFTLSVEAFGEPNGAIVVDPAGVKVFIRSESEAADALCCICDHGIDLGTFVAKIRATLDEITAGA
ncbi:hypothetical protein [Tabrizicola sp.]|uniref:hypothetical protein n=1 Tax=Tabrizicola sp. TaxID=2005166 RepID=UPI003F2B61BC